MLVTPTYRVRHLVPIATRGPTESRKQDWEHSIGLEWELFRKIIKIRLGIEREMKIGAGLWRDERGKIVHDDAVEEFTWMVVNVMHVKDKSWCNRGPASDSGVNVGVTTSMSIRRLLPEVEKRSLHFSEHVMMSSFVFLWLLYEARLATENNAQIHIGLLYRDNER